ncbi:Ionotropic receptor 404 [Blattella germanica]|nr:Ionotropic receptor 404 [Blattella germanica]
MAVFAVLCCCLLSVCACSLLPPALDFSTEIRLAHFIVEVSKTYFDAALPVAVLRYSRSRRALGETAPRVLHERMRLPQLVLGLSSGGDAGATVNRMVPGAYVLLVPCVDRPGTRAVVQMMLRRVFRDARNPDACAVVAVAEPCVTTPTSALGAFIRDLFSRALRKGVGRAVFVKPRLVGAVEVWDAFAQAAPALQRDICSLRVSRVAYMDTWLPHERRFIRGTDLFPPPSQGPSGRLDLKWCTLNVSFTNSFPFIFEAEGNIFGTALEVLVVFCMRFHCRLNMAGHVGSAHLMMPVMLEDTGSSDPSSATYPHRRDNLAWFVPAGREFPRWQSLFRVYSPLMSLLVAATSLALLLLLVATRRGHGRRYEGALASLCFVAWSFFSLQMSTRYQSGLFGLLLYPGHPPPLESLAQLQSSGLRMKNSVVLFGDSSLEPRLRHFEVCSEDLFSCLRRVAESDDTAYLCLEVAGKVYGSEFTDSWGTVRVVPLKDTFLTLYNSLLLLKLRHLLFRHLERLMSRLDDAGILDKWTRDLVGLLRRTAKREASSLVVLLPQKAFPFALGHLGGAFYLLLFGLFLSVAQFVGELLYFRHTTG